MPYLAGIAQQGYHNHITSANVVTGDTILSFFCPPDSPFPNKHVICFWHTTLSNHLWITEAHKATLRTLWTFNIAHLSSQKLRIPEGKLSVKTKFSIPYPSTWLCSWCIGRQCKCCSSLSTYDGWIYLILIATFRVIRTSLPLSTTEIQLPGCCRQMCRLSGASCFPPKQLACLPQGQVASIGRWTPVREDGRLLLFGSHLVL